MKQFIIINKDKTVGLISSNSNKEVQKEIDKFPEDKKESFDFFIEAKDIPIPQKYNWRDAWYYCSEDNAIKIDLEEAKKCQRKLIISKAMERVETNEWGEMNLSVVQDEFKEIDFESIDNLDDLYNTWPASIENRKERRIYPRYKED
ncbi:MAG: hypothetical protein CMP22_07895 [Rickettsiales bacterium]|nr:hypothetical protein [Rickettsiales bacterium]